MLYGSLCERTGDLEQGDKDGAPDHILLEHFERLGEASPNVRVQRNVVADRRIVYGCVRLTTVRDLGVGQFIVLCYRYRI